MEISSDSPHDMIRDFRENEDRRQRIKFDVHGVEIDGNYEIASNRINTPEKLLGWVYHLSQRAGYDQDFMQIFMEEVAKHYGFENYLSA